MERDKSQESLEQKLVASQVHEKELQQSLARAEDLLAKTRQEYSLVESELASVKDERRSFDDVIVNLKKDMENVEGSFAHIKQELARKTDELARLKAEKEDRNVALTQSTGSNEALADVHVKVNREVSHPTKSSHLDQSSTTTTSEVEVIKQENAKLQHQIQELLSSNKTGDVVTLSKVKRDEFNSATQQLRDTLETSSRLDIPQLQKLMTSQTVVTGGDTSELDDVMSENQQLKVVVVELVKRIEKMKEGRAEEVSRCKVILTIQAFSKYFL